MQRIRWINYEEWKEYGLEHNFNERNPYSLLKSKKLLERAWYAKGAHKKWLKDFEFNRKRDKKFHFKNFEKWSEYGLFHKFDEKYPSELIDSEVKEERSWYIQGSKEQGWIRKFKFKGKFPNKTPWQNYESWKNFGLEKKYNNKTKRSLHNSQDKTERSWYGKGLREVWTKNFEFMRRDLSKNLEYVIKEARKIMKENNWNELPPPRILLEEGYKKLAYSIMRHHNGFPAFRQKLREYMGLPSYISEENQLEKLLEDYVNS